MNEKFPYGYDVDAYIDKAFEQMKKDFPWATRDMIAEQQYLGIAKVGGDYQYVRYYSMSDGMLSPRPMNVDSQEFIRRLASGHERALEHANPVKNYINVPASCRCRGDWFLEIYRIQKHEKGAIQPMCRLATVRQVVRGRSSFQLLISSCHGRSSLTSISTWFRPVPSMWAGMTWRRQKA